MPLFMDTHRFEGEMPSDEEIRKLHAADLEAQDAHGVRYLKYWVSNDAKVVHCLVEAPNAEAASVGTRRKCRGPLPMRSTRVTSVPDSPKAGTGILVHRIPERAP